MQETKLIRAYKSDVEVLKKMNSRSMAQAINQLIYGREEEIKEAVRYYFDSMVMPYIKEKIKEVR